MYIYLTLLIVFFIFSIFSITVWFSLINTNLSDKFLNNCMGFENLVPTAENMCKIFFDILKKPIPELYAIEIYETEGASAIYEKN